MNGRLERILASLDTPGGHILVCFLMVLVGAAFVSFRVPKGEDLIIAGSSTMFLAMRGSRNGPPPPTAPA